ncbi:D-beta-D-heptose 7-phosphate kinase / D-beta-D-heptose 1-phosphate adenosyltransferase [Mucilaginibacter mallensis]|uniref:D-beta-D-heptose 7-phosphate kinase / D-beta-D-heptose 1-phosphate adenosyltransferase n=1 Tax=Mucilaginibacter mallensis TaxID=652787 RepID=A0A1H1YIF2_MUCMA|nr:D-glycero-beta-D-manno-heptose-7-phosphate kinase [Mucilaginibacter mallensis]SDT21240.1 D-beta-D-heptose 7-phosphate kinase / D-beta-D-heptose 1-phosphate adenosyltransferase [Mucilaginibacter mallensis]
MSIIDKVRSIQKSGKQPSILVIGDIMIDHYIWGGATRLSPEAPVPIVNVKKETTTLGGAGNLTQNLVSLGAKVMLGGVKGDDEAGKQLIEILSNEGVQSDTIITDINRPTTIKTRVLAGNQQIVRIDRELTDALTIELEDELLNKLIAHIDEADIVVLSDYNKGLFSPAFTQKVIKAANDRQKKVIIDPKGLNYEKYKGAFIIKPNKKELTEAAKAEKIKGIDDVREAAKAIFEQTNVTYLIVTLSEEGMAIVSKDDCKILPVKATEVFDVTGAGDTVLAAIAYFIASGLSVEEACDLANHAAAIVIRHIGSATTTIDEIIDDINNTR